MSLDERKWLAQLDVFPEVKDCIRKSTHMDDAFPSYECLFGLKNIIPKELYAYCFRTLLQFNTANVPMELRLKMFEGVDRNDIMYQSELDAIEGFGDYITIFRGASKNEEKPGLSWSLRKSIAESSDFYRGRLFTATIPTSAILLYISCDAPEEEIVAHVTSNFIVEDE